MTPELRALVIEGRRRQDLPEHITDKGALARIASILLQAEGEAKDAA